MSDFDLSSIYLQDQEIEQHYMREERDIAYSDIKELEDELADSRIMVTIASKFTNAEKLYRNHSKAQYLGTRDTCI